MDQRRRQESKRRNEREKIEREMSTLKIQPKSAKSGGRKHFD